MVVGDLCTLEIEITRGNLASGDRAAAVHAPHFPLVKPEVWWVALVDKVGRLIAMDKGLSRKWPVD